MDGQCQTVSVRTLVRAKAKLSSAMALLNLDDVGGTQSGRGGLLLALRRGRIGGRLGDDLEVVDDDGHERRG